MSMGADERAALRATAERLRLRTHLALLDALAEAEAEVDRLHNRIAVVYGEGLGERAEVTAERDHYRRQVDAVRALHTRTNGYSNGDDFDCCAVCFDADEQPEAWPCPTVRALDGAES